MALANVIINLGNGGLGRVAATDDGVAGLVLTGAPVADKFSLNQSYTLGSLRDLATLGITEENNPFIYKEVSQFYKQTGDGAELYLIGIDAETTLTAACNMDDTSPLSILINSAGGRIRLVGINRNPTGNYKPEGDKGIDPDVITAAETAQATAESFAGQMSPFRVFLPALGWEGKTDKLFKPRGASYNRVGLIMASDGIWGESSVYSAAVGLVLGRAAKIAVNVSIARVRDGALAANGYLTNGKTPEASRALWNALDEAGYIFYRTFIGKEGYYLNDDHLAAPLSDDYSALNLGRVIDKAIIIVYITYIDYIHENIAVDEAGKIPVPVCKDFEAAITRAVNIQMANEISNFEAYINPAQNIISSGAMQIDCTIVPTAILKQITVNLSFTNPFE